jgi:hypothetical protein
MSLYLLQAASVKSRAPGPIHEVRHTVQYRAHNFDLASFGTTYAYKYCKAGFEAKDIEYERQAYGIEGAMDGLLVEELNYALFEDWKKMSLFDTLGYPLNRNMTRLSKWSHSSQEPVYYELRFQHGVLQGTNPDCRFAFRVLNETDLGWRQYSKCLPK